MKLNLISALIAITLFAAVSALAQQPIPPDSNERRATLIEPAAAFDARGTTALEGRLLTTMLNGAMDSPVTNVRLVIKNASSAYYSYVTGWATFYGADGVRCGEGLFKLDALAPGESAETDTPGLRLRCTPATWRIVATNLLTRTSETAKPEEMVETTDIPTATSAPITNFVIAIDGEEHPIQLNHPIVVTMGNRQRRIVVRTAP